MLRKSDAAKLRVTSRKLNGRGLGLSISKEVLNAENYDIFVVQPKEGSTVTFKIQKM